MAAATQVDNERRTVRDIARLRRDVCADALLRIMQEAAESVNVTRWQLDWVSAPEIRQCIRDMHAAGMYEGTEHQDAAASISVVPDRTLRRDVAVVRHRAQTDYADHMVRSGECAEAARPPVICPHKPKCRVMLLDGTRLTARREPIW